MLAHSFWQLTAVLAAQIAINHPPPKTMSDDEVSDFLDAAITSFAAKKKAAANA